MIKVLKWIGIIICLLCAIGSVTTHEKYTNTVLQEQGAKWGAVYAQQNLYSTLLEVSVALFVMGLLSYSLMRKK